MVNLSSGRNRCMGIIYSSTSVTFPRPDKQSMRNQNGKVTLQGLAASHHGIQSDFSKDCKISGKEI